MDQSAYLLQALQAMGEPQGGSAPVAAGPGGGMGPPQTGQRLNLGIGLRKSAQNVRGAPRRARQNLSGLFGLGQAAGAR